MDESTPLFAIAVAAAACSGETSSRRKPRVRLTMAETRAGTGAARKAGTPLPANLAERTARAEE